MARSRQPQQPQQPQMDIDAKNRANLKQPQQPQLPGKAFLFHLKLSYLPICIFFRVFKTGRKKSFTLASAAASAATSATQINSHIIMTNNAMFLLDLASASNSNLVNISRTSKAMTASILSSVSELGCMDPNPFPLVPFQVSLHI